MSISRCAKARFSALLHLRFEAGAGRPLVEAVAGSEPGELKGRVAVHDHQPVEPQVRPRLDEQRGVGHPDRPRPADETRGPRRLNGAHPRVDDRVQPRAGGGVREDHRGERRPVQSAVGREDAGAERVGDLGEDRAPRRGDVARHRVEVERVAAAAGQPSQDVGLAARDAAGQADPQHAPPLRRRRPPRAPCSRSACAMVSGPTPPGTGVRAPATSWTEGA